MTSPRWLELALAEVGTMEVGGSANNPTVVQYFLDAVGKRYADAVPWCMAFTNAMLERSGVPGTKSLLARSALTWGKPTDPRPGAIGIWARGKPWQGHVGIVESVGTDFVWLISGNQNNRVTRRKYPKKNLGYRWPLGKEIT